MHFHSSNFAVLHQHFDFNCFSINHSQEVGEAPLAGDPTAMGSQDAYEIKQEPKEEPAQSTDEARMLSSHFQFTSESKCLVECL